MWNLQSPRGKKKRTNKTETLKWQKRKEGREGRKKEVRVRTMALERKTVLTCAENKMRCIL